MRRRLVALACAVLSLTAACTNPCNPCPPPTVCTVGYPCDAMLLTIYDLAMQRGWIDVACLATQCCTEHGPVAPNLANGCSAHPLHRQKILNVYNHLVNGGSNYQYCFNELNHGYP